MKYYTMQETAKLLNVKIRTLRDWKFKGKLQVFKLEGGKRNYITADEIRRISGGRVDV